MSFSQYSPSISQLYFHPSFSTLATDHDSHAAIHNSNVRSLNTNPFAVFAATKFNLSPADIANILKNNRSLERLKTLDQQERLVDMLERYGCRKHQIVSIMKKFPQFLSLSPEMVVERNIQLLRNLGIQDEGLAKILIRCPRFMGSSLQRSLLPALTFLKEIYKTHELLIKFISKYPSILTYNLDIYLKPSVAFWERCGMSGEEISKFSLLRPQLLQCNGLNPAKIDFIQKMGADNGSKMYKHALIIAVISRMEILEAKINNFKQLGLTTEETMEIFKVYPYMFYFSEEKIRQKFNFIVSEMGLPVHSVVEMPHLLFRSLEKVTKPRLLVLQKMNSLNGDDHMLGKIGSILSMPEAEFVNKVIKEHHESTLLNEVYQEALTNASTKSKMKANINISKK